MTTIPPLIRHKRRVRTYMWGCFWLAFLWSAAVVLFAATGTQ